MQNEWLWVVIGVVAVLVVLAIVAVLVVASGRRAIRAQRARVDDAWAAIAGHVASRGELLVELESKIDAAASHEKTAVAETAEARGALAAATDPADPAAASAAEDRVQGGIRRLLQVAEGYPELQRDTEFLRLQAELAREGGEIQAARRHFNGAVREYNTKLRTLPGSMVARGMGATPQEFFEVNDRAAIKAPPKVQF